VKWITQQSKGPQYPSQAVLNCCTGKNKMVDVGLWVKGLISSFESSLFGPISFMIHESWQD